MTAELNATQTSSLNGDIASAAETDGKMFELRDKNNGQITSDVKQKISGL